MSRPLKPVLLHVARALLNQQCGPVILNAAAFKAEGGSVLIN
jgi:hypothetical protein